MQVRVLGIHSSPRNGATAQMLKMALKYTEEVEDVSLIS